MCAVTAASPFKETQAYVRKVKQLRQRYSSHFVAGLGEEKVVYASLFATKLPSLCRQIHSQPGAIKTQWILLKLVAGTKTATTSQGERQAMPGAAQLAMVDGATIQWKIRMGAAPLH